MKSRLNLLARPAAALFSALTLTAASLLLSACGAGPNEVAKLPTAANATVTAVVSPARVVAGRIYTYEASATPGTSVTWAWGDGSPDSVGSTVQKVWNKAGNQTVTLSATAGSKAASVTQTVAVTGEPVSAGGDHTCALQPAGTVLCWGGNANNQLGGGFNGTTATVTVTGLTNAIALSSGGNHTCALKAGGRVVCWGNNTNGQLGNGVTGNNIGIAPLDVIGLTGVVAISAGGLHTCALLSNGSTQCWGDNTSGQIGDGTSGFANSRSIATAVLGLTNAVAISAGSSHTCALKTGGSQVCWGANESGQLGDGTSGGGNIQSRPVAVVALTGAVAVALSAGSEHTCALKANGSAACWGKNDNGQLGNGTTATVVVNPSAASSAVVGLTDAVAINAGGSTNSTIFKGRTCALKANGSVACWGDQGFDTNQNAVVQATPTAFQGLTDSVAISLGGNHNCALKASGAVVCWGNNSIGQIGDGTAGGIQTNLVEVTAPGGLLTDTLSVSASQQHSCAVKTGGTVLCWGNNQDGQLGDGTTITRTISTVVNGISDADAVVTGNNHTCAIKKDKTVVCWGNNGSGQLGNGTKTNSLTPATVSGITGVLELGLGSNHTCARTANEVICWGNNSFGQLGNGTTTDSLTPSVVTGITDTLELSVGEGHTCVLKKDNTVSCWGSNAYGELGNINNASTGFPNSTPVAVSGLTDAQALSAGNLHNCAIKKDSTAVCWGLNASGQLGYFTSSGNNSSTATAVTGLTDVLVLSSGGNLTCAIKKDSTVACWGSNSFGALGNITATGGITPTTVTSSTDVRQLSTGTNHSCAVKNDNTVVCWGDNQFGQLGGTTTITTSIKLRPTAVLGGSIFWR